MAKVRVKKADLEKCNDTLDVIELVSGEWLKQHHPFKRKPRHNPDKPANKYGDRCPYYEEYTTGKVGCECKSFYGDKLECKGNRHNCVKVKYHTAAIIKN